MPLADDHVSIWSLLIDCHWDQDFLGLKDIFFFSFYLPFKAIMWILRFQFQESRRCEANYILFYLSPEISLWKIRIEVWRWREKRSKLRSFSMTYVGLKGSQSNLIHCKWLYFVRLAYVLLTCGYCRMW